MLIGIGIVLIGFLLIYLEFFVPGGILGVLGGITCIGGIVFFICKAESFWPSIIFIMITLVFLAMIMKFALWKMKQRPALFAKDEQSGYVASKYDKELIGKEGVTLTSLKPSGHIVIEGERKQAVSESSFIKKGESIIVVSGEGARFIVRRK